MEAVKYPSDPRADSRHWLIHYCDEWMNWAQSQCPCLFLSKRLCCLSKLDDLRDALWRDFHFIVCVNWCLESMGQRIGRNYFYFNHSPIILSVHWINTFIHSLPFKLTDKHNYLLFIFIRYFIHGQMSMNGCIGCIYPINGWLHDIIHWFI